MDSISRVRICGTRLGMSPSEGLGSSLKPEMPEMVGLTLRVMSPSAEICGVTDMTMPTETDCGVVVAEMRACLRSSYSVVVLSTRK